MCIKVKGIANAVMAEMRAKEYDESTIGVYDRYLKQLEAYCSDGIYTTSAGDAFARRRSGSKTSCYCHNVKVFRERIVRIADCFVETGEVDLSPVRRCVPKTPTTPGFRELLMAWDTDMAERGLARGTRDYYGRLAREYILFLEADGTDNLDKAEGSTVLSFVSALRQAWPKTSTYGIVTNFRPFLKFAGHDGLVAAANMINASRPHDIVPVLSRLEEEAVVFACTEGLVPARDAAITLLALTTGLRACDILALEIGNVDWRTMTIGLIQKKTGNPLRVPMLPVVAKAISEYLLDERPHSDSQNLFLRSIAPYVPLADHASVYVVTKRAFQAAGLDGSRAGTRLLRHNAGSKMLHSGTPLPTISAVLGHANPDTTEIYLTTDAERLLACVLPLPTKDAS